MEFRTIVPIVKNNYSIDYDSKLVSLGSCFAENISAKFDYYLLRNLCNPFGIIFNAVALETIIRRIVECRCFTENDVFENNGLWHCFEVHSSLSQSDKVAYLANLNQILNVAYLDLKNATNLIITLGTSWVYEVKNTKKVVANCHKMPQSEFSKILLSQEQNATSIKNIISEIQKINHDAKFTFTISPVRHLKDGFFENNLSKSNLFAALYQVVDNNVATYFPSYEIMVDDLRDYRYYTSDFLHPSEMAIDYIWEKFSESQITKATLLIMDEVKSIQKMLSHRPINIHSDAFIKFTENIDIKIQKLQKRCPQIRISGLKNNLKFL